MNESYTKQVVPYEQPLGETHQQIYEALKAFLADRGLDEQWVNAAEVYESMEFSSVSFGEFISAIRGTDDLPGITGIELTTAHLDGCLAILIRLAFTDVFLEQHDKTTMPHSFVDRIAAGEHMPMADRVEYAIARLADIGDPSPRDFRFDSLTMSPNMRHSEIRKAMTSVANLELWDVALRNLAPEQRTERTDLLQKMVDERTTQACQIIVALQSKN